MANGFSYLALLVWPIVSVVLFTRLNPLQAAFWTVVGGALLLPVNVSLDMPSFPSFDKVAISSLSAMIAVKLIGRRKVSWIPKLGLERWLIIALILSPVITALTNGEVVFRGSLQLNGLTLYHGLSDALSMYFFVVPFILFRQLVNTHDDVICLLKLIVIAGLLYSIPILIEIRLSPQLHTWVYGFFPHQFIQQMRFGGFRPVVFLGHGLVVSMFVVVVLGAATLLWKSNIRVVRYAPSKIVLYFAFILLLCKSVGPGFLGLVLIIAVGWLPLFLLSRLTAVTACVVIGYPLLCLYGLFPHEVLVDFVDQFDRSKSGSLGFRFYHEAQLLDLAVQKPFFGWGGWGRNRLVDSITDGYWIIIMGKYGFFGFVGIFGLLGYSVMKGLKGVSYTTDVQEKRVLLGLALLVALIMVDQIPNSSLSRSWMLFLAGALLARASSLIHVVKGSQQANPL